MVGAAPRTLAGRNSPRRSRFRRYRRRWRSVCPRNSPNGVRISARPRPSCTRRPPVSVSPRPPSIPASRCPAVLISRRCSSPALECGNSRQYGIGPAISLPLFEGGRLHGMLQLRKAQQQEAAIAYKRTVLKAWQDVDDALTAYNAMQDRRDRLKSAVQQDRIALVAAQLQYSQGSIDFLNVLTVQDMLLGAQSATGPGDGRHRRRPRAPLQGARRRLAAGVPGHRPPRTGGLATDAGKPAPRRTDEQRHPEWSGQATNGHRLVDRMIRFRVERYKNSLRRARRPHPGGF